MQIEALEVKIRESRPGPGVLVRAARALFSYPALLGLGLATVCSLTVAGRFNDPDLWWHLRLGQIIWNTRSIPLTDSLSYTAYGHSVVPHEWLSQVGIYGAYLLGGYSGLMVGLTIMASLLFGLVYVLCYLRSGDAMISFLGGLLAWFLGTVGLAIRPLLPGHVLLAAELILLELGARDRRWLWLLPPLFALWVNVHGSWLFGLGALLLYWACAHVEYERGLISCRRWDAKERRRLSAALILSVAALFANPVGPRLILYPLNALLLQPLNLNSVEEWFPPSLKDGRTFGLILAAAAVVAIPLWKRSRLSLYELLLVAGAGALAFRHARMLLLFGIVATPVLCRLLGSAGKGLRRDHPILNAALMATLLATIISAFPGRGEIERQVRAANPAAAVDYVRRSGLSGPVLNDYAFGGFLTWAMPENKVFIDGRAEVYEWAGILDKFGRWATLVDDPKRLLDEYHVRICLLSSHAPMRHVMPYLPGWRRVYEDDVAVVFAR